MTSSADNSLKVERRPHQRRRVLLGGLVAYEEGAQSFRCVIRNLAPGGACISVPSGRFLPPRFHLINVRERIVYDALTIWMNGSDAGVAFLERLQLEDLKDSKLFYLEKLWQGSATRSVGTESFI